MNLLTHDPPTELEIGGVFYPIDAHYRNGLVILEAFEDVELTRGEQFSVMLKRLFTGVPGHPEAAIPPDEEAAARAAIDFLNCGEALTVSKGGPTYSFTQDAKYIRSAIEKSHRINLEEVGFLHWWKFIYMFFDLDEDCFLSRLMDLRSRKKKNNLSKEEKAWANEHPELFHLPRRETVADQELEDEIDARYKAAIAKRKGGGLIG